MLVLGVNGDLNVAFITVTFDLKHADLYHKMLVTQPLSASRFVSQGVSQIAVINKQIYITRC